MYSMQDSTLDYYNRSAPELAERYEQIELAAMHAILAQTFAGRRKLLEAGCGSGRDAAFLLSKGHDISAVDGSQAMLEQARRFHPELNGRLFHVRFPGLLPFPSASFDGAYSIAFLMHLDRSAIAEAVSEIHRILEPDGLFFFSASLERGDVDSAGIDPKGRRFTSLSEQAWDRLCGRLGFRKLSFSRTADSAGREGLVWGNFLYRRLKDPRRPL